jgi:ribonuclease T1
MTFISTFMGAGVALIISLAPSQLSVTARSFPGTAAPIPLVAQERLPAEARDTIRLIDRGGPFPFRKDGTVFGNRERRLPLAPRGTYREYTVVTPGVAGRGPRRIVASPRIKYYSPDHYRSFQRIRE